MKAVTAEMMKNIENKAMDILNIDSIILMENAALGVVDECTKYLKTCKTKRAVIFAGKGNNGGDGLAIARHLFLTGNDVTVVLATRNMDNATTDCFKNYNIVQKLGIRIINFSEENLRGIDKVTESSDIIVDALIGTGLKRELSDDYCTMTDIINKGNYIISVDCPTGLDSDTGKIYNKVVKADTTVTFHLPKLGLFLAKISNIVIKKISIPYVNEDLDKIKYNVMTYNEMCGILPKRNAVSNKGDFGKIYVFAGCKLMTGAAVLNASAAYAVGCGLVNVCSVKEVADVVHFSLPEAVTTLLSNKDGYLCSESYSDIKASLERNAGVIVVGSGLGDVKTSNEFVYELVENANIPMVIDADGLNALAKNIDVLKLLKAPCVITPHIKEMSRLTGLSVDEILENKIDTAIEFSRKYNVITVLKDAVTIIANPNGEVYVNTSGTSAMAKAGSGDCLAGSIAGFAAQGVELFKAAALGAYVNGCAGEMAAENLGHYSVMARDIIKYIPQVLM